MSRTFKIKTSALKHRISEEQIEHVLANIPQYREDDGEDDNGNSREVVIGCDALGNLIELMLIYDNSSWDFIVVHANKAQQPYKGRFLRNK